VFGMIRVGITVVFALMMSVTSVIGPASAKNWNTGSSNQPSKQVKKLPPFTNINESTERFRRTQIFCKIAKEPKLKPFPKGIDDFRSSSDFMTYADLFGDGTIELITGVNDSAYIADSQSFPNEGNKERATKPIPHSIYSPKTNFNLGINLEFHNAHIFTSDINRDGKDDVIFAQQGRDFAPFEKKNNFLLLSNNDGYRLLKLPGKKSPYHHGTAGDIDNDGDIDIIITPGLENRVVAYINNGDETFSFREIGGSQNGSWDNNPRYFFATLWDIDEDGFLDLVLGSQKDPTKIIWGNGKSSFSGPSITLPNKDDYYFDLEFADFDGDGKKELITLGSLYNPARGHQAYYSGWHIQKIKIVDRKVVSVEDIDKVMSDRNTFMERYSACDIQEDGDLDLVYERHRQFLETSHLTEQDPSLDLTTISRLIWFNQNGKFKRIRIEEPNYYRGYEKDKRDAIIKHAKSLGTTVERYTPEQQYYPYAKDGNYVHRKRRPVAQPFLDRLE